MAEGDKCEDINICDGCNGGGWVGRLKPLPKKTTTLRGFGFFFGFWGVLDGSEGQKRHSEGDFRGFGFFFWVLGGFRWLRGPKKT